MLDSRQRANLRARAQKLDPIVHVGKGGVNQGVIDQANEALLARELIKVTVQNNSGVETYAAADILAEATGADVVQTIGRRFILYRPHPDEPRLDPNRPPK